MDTDRHGLEHEVLTHDITECSMEVLNILEQEHHYEYYLCSSVFIRGSFSCVAGRLQHTRFFGVVENAAGFENLPGIAK